VVIYTTAPGYVLISPASQYCPLVSPPLTYIQVTVAASPPFGGTEIDHLQLNSQEYLTPGCQVLGGYEMLGTLPDMISSPGSHFAVLEYIKII
jgi:hypothetical protein